MAANYQSRVKLVRFSRKYAEDFLAAVKRSRRLHRNLVTPVRTKAAFDEFVNHSRSPRCSNFLVVLRKTGELAGAIDISGIFRGYFQSAFLGYYAFTPHAGKGLMREGLIAALDHAFDDLKLNRIEANIQPTNQRSIALVSGLGFQLEGFSPRYLKVSGRWQDHERWALHALNWRTDRKKARQKSS